MNNCDFVFNLFVLFSDKKIFFFYSERPGYDPGEGPEASGKISYKISNITIVDLNKNIKKEKIDRKSLNKLFSVV